MKRILIGLLGGCFRTKSIVKKLFIFIWLALLLVPASVFARTENGITITDHATAHSNILSCTFFEGYNPPGASTYYYNSANGTSSLAGAVTCQGIYTAKTLLLSVPTLGSTSITIRIEGKTRNSTTWGDVYTQTFSSATVIDTIINFIEYGYQTRIGVMSNGTKGTDSVYVTGDFVSAW